MKFLNSIKKIPQPFRYIIFLFVSTRIILTIVGITSRKFLDPLHKYGWIYSKHLWLDIWGVWDSGWYLEIAQNFYRRTPDLANANFGFFPFYPLLIKIFGFVLRDNYIAGIFISNVCLIFSCIFLYKLVNFDNDKKTALRAIKYLFLFPTAFILSGVFSESLFLLLLLICFYYAKKERWFIVGVSGFFLSLTRPYGVLMFLPLSYEYFKSRKFNFNKINFNFLFLLLIPLGLLVFSIYSYYMTGTFLAYTKTKQQLWHVHLSNPFKILVEALQSGFVSCFISAFTIVCLVILCVFYKRIGFSYWLVGIILILFPIFFGIVMLNGLMRYSLVVFPFFILFSELSKNKIIDDILTICLALLQGFLMVFWVTGFNLII